MKGQNVTKIRITIIVLVCLVAGVSSYAQSTLQNMIDNSDDLKVELSSQLAMVLIRENSIESIQHEYPSLTSDRWLKEWKSEDLPIFCRIEHLMQQKSGIAFRFRLGSLDYVDALEGK